MRIRRSVATVIVAATLAFTANTANTLSLRSLTPPQRRAFTAWIAAVQLRAYFHAVWMHPSSPYSDATLWRVAVCETGGDIHAHGNSYSSPFGTMNAGVPMYADSPASAQRILAGLATYDESLRMVKRWINRVGIHGWAEHTVHCAGIE